MADDEEDGDEAESAVDAGIPGGVEGNVSHPTDEELAKGHVGPEDDEGEEEIAQIVEDVGLDRFFEGFAVAENHDNGRGPPERSGPGHDEQESEDGGIPMGFAGHDPVDAGEGHGDDVEDKAGGADAFEADEEGGIAAGVAGE